LLARLNERLKQTPHDSKLRNLRDAVKAQLTMLRARDAAAATPH
jgi:hypothetical protein